MSPEEHDLLALKGAVSELDEDDQYMVKETATRLRLVLAEGDHALMAFGIVGMEIAVKHSKEDK